MSHYRGPGYGNVPRCDPRSLHQYRNAMPPPPPPHAQRHAFPPQSYPPSIYPYSDNSWLRPQDHRFYPPNFPRFQSQPPTFAKQEMEYYVRSDFNQRPQFPGRSEAPRMERTAYHSMGENGPVYSMPLPPPFRHPCPQRLYQNSHPCQDNNAYQGSQVKSNLCSLPKPPEVASFDGGSPLVSPSPMSLASESKNASDSKCNLNKGPLKHQDDLRNSSKSSGNGKAEVICRKSEFVKNSDIRSARVSGPAGLGVSRTETHNTEGRHSEGFGKRRRRPVENPSSSKRFKASSDDGRYSERSDSEEMMRSRRTVGEKEDDKRIEEELELLLENCGEEKIVDWVRCSPADLYFKRDQKTGLVCSTKRMHDLEKKFEMELLSRASCIRSQKPPVVVTERYRKKYKPKASKKSKEAKKNADPDDEEEEDDDDSDGFGSSTDDEKYDPSEPEDGEEGSSKTDIIDWKNQHPEKMHDEMWFNLPGEMNDGPLCRCSNKTRSHGIRHNIYPGEQNIKKCHAYSCNSDKLCHYKITMSPHTNFLTKNPTIIFHDGHEYIFEGFSLFSHYKLLKVPTCKVIRFNIEYTIHWFEEDTIENFDVKSLDLFSDFLCGEILELLDLDWIRKDCEFSCRCFHLMPRFSRSLPDNGKEILSMNEVLKFMLESNKPLIDDMELGQMLRMTDHEWQDFVDEIRGMIVSYPGKRPSSLRIDQLDRAQSSDDVIHYPKIIHFGYRPAQLSYVGDAVYSKLFKQYMKLKYLVANKPKLTLKDRERLRQLEDQLQEIRLKGTLKREMTVEMSSEGFVRTGLKSDICQHALLLPVLLQHLRFHKCLEVLEGSIGYQFKDRLYLQMAMTHPSFRMNYGTNPDHARNSLSNCGMRQLEYGNRHIHYMHTRKRGIKTLMHIMSKMARAHETPSEIHHYERLEFLGDTVIEFLSSIHLFFLFPRLEEGGLATYRAALVQNQHLTVLAQKLGLQHFLLYAHGPDLCRDLDLRYALANCFEALLGSLFLDGGIEVADRIFGEALFRSEPHLLDVWKNLPSHPLQEDEPMGDRHWIDKSKPLQKLVKFEEETGFKFNHIRILARAFTMRNIGFNNLTLGHNQTLEFLGDTILQFITSEYLFKHFPDHHEGHLTLLRSSLVNNKTQAIICDDLGTTEYVINNDPKVKERMENEKNKVKDKADILEAFIGALYVDQGLDPCIIFCQVCFYPRLKEFIMNQDWNDAKSQLQQCCLTLRDPTDGEPDIPVYKVLQCTGPTNTRKYHVAVYFRGERLATGIGHSIQQGEMNAATNALKEKSDMFPHLLQTKQYLDWRFGRTRGQSRQHLHGSLSKRFPDRDHSRSRERRKFSGSEFRSREVNKDGASRRGRTTLTGELEALKKSMRNRESDF